MIRYLRGRGFLDLLGDAVRWLVPGAVGKAAAFVVVLTMALAMMYVTYVRSYATIAKWF